jgi:hypothetical protein
MLNGRYSHERWRNLLYELVKLLCGDWGYAPLYGTMKAEERDDVVDVAMDFCIHGYIGTLAVESCNILCCISI